MILRGVSAAFEQMHHTWQHLGADDRLSTQLWDVPHSCGIDIQAEMLRFFQKHL